jgi:hypothetical protein
MRSIAAKGAALPIAFMLEYPDGIESTEFSDGAGRTLLPTGDVRDELRRIVEQSTLDELRAGWAAAVERRIWANDLCAAVEVELHAQTPGRSISFGDLSLSTMPTTPTSPGHALHPQNANDTSG